MTESAPPLASGPLGMRLLAFDRVPEDTRFDDGVPVGYSLVALWRAGLLLLVHVRGRDCWELPGGGLDPDETPRQAAARELAEESGQHVAPRLLRFAGFALTSLPGRDVLRGAVYRAETDAAEPFAPTAEISGIHWWDGAGPLPHGRLQTVDARLAELVGR
ncbi:NUDIX domain-containing protein [Streptomyces marincola]|uniref:NUDIX domain-containing protein n=1 Tax=Streptomyces marincola TaxID=2878388 RepID=UPI00298FD249|nr:NUDIX domain-containing protein [Streptomyces marincola]